MCHQKKTAQECVVLGNGEGGSAGLQALDLCKPVAGDLADVVVAIEFGVIRVHRDDLRIMPQWRWITRREKQQRSRV